MIVVCVLVTQLEFSMIVVCVFVTGPVFLPLGSTNSSTGYCLPGFTGTCTFIQSKIEVF